MAKTSIKASDIFSDDDDDEEEEEQDQMKEPQPAEDLDIVEIDDGDEDMEVVKDVKETEPVQEEPSEPAPAGKARRKVLKKRTTKNSRGHLGKSNGGGICTCISHQETKTVTEEYWDWEVVDEAQVKSTLPTTPFRSKAPSTAKKPTNSKNAKKSTGQSNLLSFFKKA